MAYDQRFYDSIRGITIASATAAVPVLYNHFRPKSVIDVGCGEGWWLDEFRKLGANCFGIDDNGAPDLKQDLEHGFETDKFDLCLCLEVAEHLSPQRARSFVKDLCGVSNQIIFSAAIPGQGGEHHVNEQWAEYWIELFKSQGYFASAFFRWLFWDDERIAVYYRQNILWFSPLNPEKHIPNVVHPKLWQGLRNLKGA